MALRPTWAEIDLAAVRANVGALRQLVAPAAVLAVVKADGYGHGAVEIARVALDAGAVGLAVALVEEAEALRAAEVHAPILLLSDAAPNALARAVELGVALTVSTHEGVQEARAAGAAELHLKIDTGMHRAGCEPAAAAELALAAGPALVAVWTHLSEADDLASNATVRQIDRFDHALGSIAAAGCSVPLVHLANSAGALAHPAARRDVVRCGIAVYGIAPSVALADAVDLVPAMSLRSRVRALRTVAAGETVSYGGHWRAEGSTRIATVPIGYADGVPRRLGLVGGEVIVRGRRAPIRGVVTMDQLMVEVDGDVALDDEVVLLGAQGGAAIDPWEWATRLDTIAYEIVTGIGPRVPRRYLRG